MQETVIGSIIKQYGTVGSTNDIALKLAEQGAAEGMVIRADAQTRGRGRIGRSWNSGAGKGLYLTVILRPALPARSLGLLSLAAGAAIRAALKASSGLEGTIKWPNDVLVKGKKIAGVLLESRAGSSGVQHLVLGIGINTKWNEADLKGEFRVPPTAVNLQAGVPADRELLFNALLRELDGYYQELCKGDFSRLKGDVVRYLDRIGENVSLALPDRVSEGIIEGIGDGR